MMTSTQILIMFAELFGGLAFFLYGMSTMSSGLEKTAGGRLERTLKRVSKNDFLGFLIGAGITIAIQSSSAMTVMLVGLVNSGIMGFADTFGMIMGSHVGTTLTAWILTLSGISGDDNFFVVLLRPETFAPILALVGIVISMVSKREKKKTFGAILIGFAILMAGMQMMSNSMDGLRQDSFFQALLEAFKNPAVAFLVSAVFTGIVQSSAATVAIVQAMALNAFLTSNPITYQIAIPLVVGANVGTCMTALVSGIGTSKEAKRVIAMHFYTNAVGGIVCIILTYVVMGIAPDLLSFPISIIGVATVHSLFNILNTIAFIPLKKPLLLICEKTIRKKKEEIDPVFLDERLFNNTPIAISECKRLTVEMANISRNAIRMSIDAYLNYNQEEIDKVVELEKLTDRYEDKLSTYLVRLSKNDTTEAESHAIARMLHGIGDYERISDHALNITKLSEEIKEKNIHFSEQAAHELNVITNAVLEILDMAVESFSSDDAAMASHVEPLEQVIDSLQEELKNRHVNRLQSGECTVSLGFVFNDLLVNYERVSDHCSNLAVYTMQLTGDELDAHKYLNQYKTSEGQFADEFAEYSRKYSL